MTDSTTGRVKGLVLVLSLAGCVLLCTLPGGSLDNNGFFGIGLGVLWLAWAGFVITL